MNKKEAIFWLKGELSSTNIIPRDPYETWEVRIAECDAARTQQAYWILKAHSERLIEVKSERLIEVSNE